VAVFPPADLAVTSILVVSDLDRSKRWYLDVLGASLYGEYGGHVGRAEPRECLDPDRHRRRSDDDKPTVGLAPPPDPDVRDNLFTMRVATAWRPTTSSWPEVPNS
jgi:catechol 2,3-dioxygenase-like lactoylglutathione lyase family enzyme